MLLETKRGKENKVEIPVGTEDARGNHGWTREGGYQAKPYVHEEYPKMLYKRRVLGDPAIVNLLNDLFGVEEPDDRQDIYLNAMREIGESGVDVRSWPMTAPTDAMLKSMQSVLKLHAHAQLRDEWLAKNPDKTAVDYKRYVDSPETVEASSEAEEQERLNDGWCLTSACVPVEA